MSETVQYKGKLTEIKANENETLQQLHKKLFGCGFDDAHDAMNDIRATAKCFFELKRLGILNGKL